MSQDLVRFSVLGMRSSKREKTSRSTENQRGHSRQMWTSGSLPRQQPVVTCGYSALEMWLVLREMSCKCKIHTGFQRLGMKKKKGISLPKKVLYKPRILVNNVVSHQGMGYQLWCYTWAGVEQISQDGRWWHFSQLQISKGRGPAWTLQCRTAETSVPTHHVYCLSHLHICIFSHLQLASNL